MVNDGQSGFRPGGGDHNSCMSFSGQVYKEDVATCWKCKSTGSALDEFTSPYTGLCAMCSNQQTLARGTTMKATLEFDLDDQDDRMAHLRCVKAADTYRALYKITGLLHQMDETEEHDQRLVEAVISDIKEKVHDIIDSCGINLDEEYT